MDNFLIKNFKSTVPTQRENQILKNFSYNFIKSLKIISDERKTG